MTALLGKALAEATARIARHDKWLALAIMACAAVWLVRSAPRPFWFDEMLTFHISRLPSVDQLLLAIPADGNPPMGYLLVRLSHRLAGHTELATRLPSIVAFVGALLASYLFVRRHCGAVPALLAMFTLATSGMAVYGGEARPYALLMGFTGLALVSWQAATEEDRPRLPALLGVAAGIAGAIASHHYGVFHVGIPLALGEAVRLIERRRLDLPLYGAGLVGLATLGLTFPFAQATNQVMLSYVRDSPSFWAKPGFASLDSYQAMASPWVLGIFVILFLAMRFLFRNHETVVDGQGAGGPPAHEIAAAVGLALLVPAMIGITWMATGYYLPRYAISAAMGVAILVGFAAHRFARSPMQGAVAAVLCMAIVTATFVATRAVDRLARSTNGTQVPTRVSALDGAPTGLPIVVGSALAYLPTWWYAGPELRWRLHYLSDLEYAVRQSDFLPELSLVANQPYVPSKVDAYRAFLAAHAEFLLYCVGDERLNWTKSRLKSEGRTLQLLYQHGDQSLFLVKAPSP